VERGKRKGREKELEGREYRKYPIKIFSEIRNEKKKKKIKQEGK
jgi:hypothetical protein